MMQTHSSPTADDRPAGRFDRRCRACKRTPSCSRCLLGCGCHSTCARRQASSFNVAPCPVPNQQRSRLAQQKGSTSLPTRHSFSHQPPFASLRRVLPQSSTDTSLRVLLTVALARSGLPGPASLAWGNESGLVKRPNEFDPGVHAHGYVALVIERGDADFGWESVASRKGGLNGKDLCGWPRPSAGDVSWCRGRSI